MLFPDCAFELRLPNMSIRPGDKVTAEMVVDTHKAVPSASALLLDYRVRATAAYGSGKNRSVQEETLFRDDWSLPLQGGLGAGCTRFPFELHLPRNLPPAYKGEDCKIEHAISARLDVPWARDPHARFLVDVRQRRRKGPVTPLFSRTSAAFHESLLFEITLESSIVAEDAPLRGKIALRGGNDAAFDRLTVSTAQQATIVMGRHDMRSTTTATCGIDAEALRVGDPVPFEFPPNSIAARFKSGFIDLDTVLILTLEIPWRSDPVALIPLKIMPAGSRMYGEGGAPEIGNARTQRIAAALAEHTGFHRSSGAELVKGRVRAIGISLVDVTRDARTGVDARFELPSLQLGTSFRPVGALDVFRRDGLAPPFLVPTCALWSAPGDHVPRYDDATLSAFYARVLGGLEGGSNFRFTDRALAAHFTLANEDELGSARAVADRAIEVAKAIADAIAGLPFPEPCRAYEQAWRAFAAEDPSLVLVPSGPAIHGVVIGRRVSNGDQRVVRATVGTAWSEKGPFTRATVTFDSEGLDEERLGDFASEEGSVRVEAVRATYPHVELDAAGATLDAASFLGDPRKALAGLERFLEWLIHARGERIADAPYR